MGWPEIGLILVVGLLLFGPDKLPGMAKQAGQFVRTVRQMADNAKNDLGREMGQDFSDLNLRDLDARGRPPARPRPARRARARASGPHPASRRGPAPRRRGHLSRRPLPAGTARDLVVPAGLRRSASR
jgi:sec-independent protein translocase protein TatB